MDTMVNAKKNPMYRYLIVLTISSTVGLQAWQTLFNNFAVDVAGLNGHHVGMIQSIREIPGFLALLAVFVILTGCSERIEEPVTTTENQVEYPSQEGRNSQLYLTKAGRRQAAGRRPRRLGRRSTCNPDRGRGAARGPGQTGAGSAPAGRELRATDQGRTGQARGDRESPGGQ